MKTHSAIAKIGRKKGDDASSSNSVTPLQQLSPMDFEEDFNMPVGVTANSSGDPAMLDALEDFHGSESFQNSNKENVIEKKGILAKGFNL